MLLAAICNIHKEIKRQLFVCLFFFVSLENLSLIWRRHHYHWRGANFELCLALMAIEQWGFFNVPHPLWHGASLYNGHLRGPVKHTYCQALAVQLSLPAFTQVCRGWDSTSHPSAFKANALTDCTTAVARR